MHGILFQAKRVHLSAVRWGRRLLEDVGVIIDSRGREVQLMTPARFDLLYAIFSNSRHTGPWRFTATQSHLRRILGLHTSTVSKMVKRLIELDILFEREDLDPDIDFFERDQRRRVVTITEFGLQLLHRARAIVFGQRILTTTLQEHVWRYEMPRSRRRWRFHAAMFGLYSTIHSLAHVLGDQSTGLYLPARNGTRDRQSDELAHFNRTLKPFERFYSGRPMGPPPWLSEKVA